jgi:hypothetical protein
MSFLRANECHEPAKRHSKRGVTSRIDRASVAGASFRAPPIFWRGGSCGPNLVEQEHQPSRLPAGTLSLNRVSRAGIIVILGAIELVWLACVLYGLFLVVSRL